LQIETLADARAYLDGFLNLEKTADFAYERLGLERIRALLSELGNPERELACVHIAGSKGKGSTAWMTEALLAAAGLRVGTYTSPHLECWSERFRVAGKSVPEAVLVRALRGLFPAAERLRRDPLLRPSFFDVSTALALCIFREERVDAAVIEVGMGGRIDSTNVITPRVSLITSIQLEHTEKLGHTLEAIGREKAGILRDSVPAFHGPLDEEALGAVLACAVAANSPVDEVRGISRELSLEQHRVELMDGREVVTSVLGEHQAHNVALAIRAAESFLGRPLGAAELEALRQCRPPARFEVFDGRVILDCAHTPDSIAALRGSLERLAPERRWVLVTAISRDKDAASILEQVAPRTRSLIACRAESVRSLDPEELEAMAWASGIEDVSACELPREAWTRALERAGPEDLIVVTGSVYLAGALRRHLLESFVGCL